MASRLIRFSLLTFLTVIAAAWLSPVALAVSETPAESIARALTAPTRSFRITFSHTSAPVATGASATASRASPPTFIRSLWQVTQ